jgi:hypothetical protein
MAHQKKASKRTLVMHRKKGLCGPIAQKLPNGHVKSVGQHRDQNGPAPA